MAISQVRKALGDKARSPTYIKTLPGFGYRLIAPVVEVTPAPAGPVRCLQWTLLLSLVIVAAASVWWGMVSSRPGRRAAPICRW